jgi:hypothetical protein
VTLTEQVRSFSKRKEAERAVWSSPGVKSADTRSPSAPIRALNSLARQPRAAFPVTPSAVASLRRPARLASGVAAGPGSGLLRKELRASRWPIPSNPRSGHMPSETVDAWTKTADWIHLKCSKYLEIPGLHLTRNQVQRLWGLDTVRCDAILDALVDAGFLRRTHRGAYVRADGGGR